MSALRTVVRVGAGLVVVSAVLTAFGCGGDNEGLTEIRTNLSDAGVQRVAFLGFGLNAFGRYDSLLADGIYRDQARAFSSHLSDMGFVVDEQVSRRRVARMLDEYEADVMDVFDPQAQLLIGEDAGVEATVIGRAYPDGRYLLVLAGVQNLTRYVLCCFEYQPESGTFRRVDTIDKSRQADLIEWQADLLGQVRQVSDQNMAPLIDQLSEIDPARGAELRERVEDMQEADRRLSRIEDELQGSDPRTGTPAEIARFVDWSLEHGMLEYATYGVRRLRTQDPSLATTYREKVREVQGEARRRKALEIVGTDNDPNSPQTLADLATSVYIDIETGNVERGLERLGLLEELVGDDAEVADKTRVLAARLIGGEVTAPRAMREGRKAVEAYANRRFGGNVRLAEVLSTEERSQPLPRAEYRIASRSNSVRLPESRPRTTYSSRGPRSIEEIEAAAGQSRRAIDGCYRVALASDPSLSGSVIVRITVGEDGRVVRADVVGGDLNNATVEQCLVTIVRSWRLSAGIRQTFEYPFAFEAR